MRVEIVAEVTPALVAAFERLTPQLSRSNPAPSAAQLAEIVASPATDLFVALDDEQVGGSGGAGGAGAPGYVVGALTLARFRIPTGTRAWIEDVVVDESARGRGVGEALCRAALERARQAGAVTVDLTSRPGREAANRLYQRLGFERRQTNVWRYDLRA